MVLLFSAFISKIFWKEYRISFTTTLMISEIIDDAVTTDFPNSIENVVIN